jgi:hypothetical protein
MADNIADILKQARALFDDGRFEEARLQLERNLTEVPSDTKLLNFLAYLYYRLNNLEKARDTYRRLTSIEVDNLVAWSNLGLINYKLGLYDDAAGAFEEYLKQQPDDSKVLEYMSLVMNRLGRPASARSFHSQAMSGRIGSVAPAAGEPGGEGGGGTPADAESQREQSFAPIRTSDLGEWCLGFSVDLDPLPPFSPSTSRYLPVRISSPLLFPMPSLVSWRGILVFDQGANPYGRIPREYRDDRLILLSAEGNGSLWLTHDAGGITSVSLNRETLFVNAHRLVAVEPSLDIEWHPLGKRKFLPGLAVLRISGSGNLALAAGDGATGAAVREGSPQMIVPRRLVAWTEGLDAAIDDGEDLKKLKGLIDPPLIRIEGTGAILMAAESGR